METNEYFIVDTEGNVILDFEVDVETLTTIVEKIKDVAY